MGEGSPVSLLLSPVERARVAFDAMGDDPEVWLTHGYPSDGKRLRIIAYIAAAIEDAWASQGWRPIETAPKNGSAVLIWGSVNGSCGGISVAMSEGGHRWVVLGGDVWAEDRYGGSLTVSHATHWMPLPAPPEQNSAHSRAVQPGPQNAAPPIPGGEE